MDLNSVGSSAKCGECHHQQLINDHRLMYALSKGKVIAAERPLSPTQTSKKNCPKSNDYSDDVISYFDDSSSLIKLIQHLLNNPIERKHIERKVASYMAYQHTLPLKYTYKNNDKATTRIDYFVSAVEASVVLYSKALNIYSLAKQRDIFKKHTASSSAAINWAITEVCYYYIIHYY